MSQYFCKIFLSFGCMVELLKFWLYGQITFLRQIKTITAVYNYTTFSLGNKVPVDNPRLHGTKKLEKEYPA